MESGSNGIVVAVLLKVKKSLTWARRIWAVDLLCDMLAAGMALRMEFDCLAEASMLSKLKP